VKPHATTLKKTSRPLGRLEMVQPAYAAGLAVFLVLIAAFFRFKYARRRCFLIDLLYCLPISVLYFNSVFRFCVFTMVIHWLRFNTYLPLLACALCGCETTRTKSDKPLARLTVTVESNREAEGRSEIISVSRAQPMTIKIQSSALLNESHVAEARLMDSFAGFTMLLQFTPMGTHLLEQFTAQYPGRRFAIAAMFGEKELKMRWLAAPVLNRRITDGILAFTPDASREEAELIVRGLNNVAIKIGNQQKPKKKARSAKS
jgi:hypothetical protein